MSQDHSNELNEESHSEAKPASMEGSGKDKAREYQEQILRIRADFENTKKRLERDKLDAIRFANETLIVEILPIMDNLDRALASLTEGHDPEKVKQGLRIAQEELHKVLEKHGVQTVKTVGAEFDPRFHEAVATVDDNKFKDGAIVDEVQRGYTLNGRLVRPSRVRIAQKQE